jgi:hypothetical protein
MLKKSLAAGFVVLLLAQATPAQAAGAVDGVEIAWADSAHTKIRITWTEAAPVANTLRFESPGWQDPLPLGSTTAAGANELTINSSHLGYSDVVDAGYIVVAGPAGEESRSPEFDRYLPPTEPLFTREPGGAIRWRALDTTNTPPDDPLDLEGTTRYKPRLLFDQDPRVVDRCGAVDLPTTSEPQGPVPDQDKPYTLTIGTANEWNPRGRYRFGAEVMRSTATLTAPAVTRYGDPILLTGTLLRHHIVAFPHHAVCYPDARGNSGTLEARNSPTSAWYRVGNLPAEYEGDFTATVRNTGAREYRAVLSDGFTAHEIYYGATTASKAVRTTTRVVSAKFIQPVISYGTKPQAYLWVDPAGTQRAALQFKNASGAWQGLTWKTLYAGRGLVAFNWYRRGATQFRWWVPGSTTSTGLKVDPVYSNPFTLTVR